LILYIRSFVFLLTATLRGCVYLGCSLAFNVYFMGYQFSFPFRNTTYPASVLFSFEEEPYFLMTTLLDAGLVNEFGENLSIKTDGDAVLPHPGETPATSQLKSAVFDHLKKTPAFVQMKAKYGSRKRQHRKDLKQGRS
jgi:hypothetical protein